MKFVYVVVVLPEDITAEVNNIIELMLATNLYDILKTTMLKRIGKSGQAQVWGFFSDRSETDYHHNY